MPWCNPFVINGGGDYGLVRGPLQIGLDDSGKSTADAQWAPTRIAWAYHWPTYFGFGPAR